MREEESELQKHILREIVRNAVDAIGKDYCTYEAFNLENKEQSILFNLFKKYSADPGKCKKLSIMYSTKKGALQFCVVERGLITLTKFLPRFVEYDATGKRKEDYVRYCTEKIGYAIFTYLNSRSKRIADIWVSDDIC